jgi:hypothetical protein
MNRQLFDIGGSVTVTKCLIERVIIVWSAANWILFYVP